MNRHNQTSILLILLTTALVTRLFTTNVPTAVLADSKLLRRDTHQATNCETVGAASPVSDSCNQRAANNADTGQLSISNWSIGGPSFCGRNFQLRSLYYIIANINTLSESELP